MIKLKKIIQEYKDYGDDARSVRISSDDAIKMLSSINLANLKDHLMYRGNRALSENGIYLVKPSNFNRISQNTSNEYTLLMDNLPSWKDYPKRSKSIVCSNNYVTATVYTEESYAHVVIPISKPAKVGVCQENDIWYSFNLSDGNITIDVMNDIFVYLKREFTKNPSSTVHNNTIIKDWSDFLKLFDDIDNDKEKLERLANSDDYTFNRLDRIYWYKKYITGNDKLFNVINEEFSPNKNGFKLINDYHSEYKEINNVNASFDKKHELWTDADCILLPSKLFEKMS